MSYPVNVALDYTAIATTSGQPTDTFAYSWLFDDSAVGTGATVAHTWATPGDHWATVTATDNQTLGKASSTKIVKVVNSWTTAAAAIPSWDNSFAGCHARELSSGVVLLIGTRTDNNDAIGNSCYIYNSVTHSLVPTGKIPSTRIKTSGYASTVLSNGDILLDGGFSTGSAFNPGTNLAFIYSKLNGTWSQVSSRNYPNEYATMQTSVLMPNGKVFSANCQGAYGSFDEIYDPTANSWSVITPSRSPSGAFNAPSVCLMTNGSIFRGPGIADTSNICNSFNPSTGLWTNIANCPYTKARIVNVGGGKLLAIQVQTTNPACSLYDPITNTWTATGSPTITATPQYIGAISLRNGNVAIWSGNTTQVCVYNYISGTWITYPSLNSLHNNGSMIDTNDTMCVFGSADGTSTSIEYI